MHATRVSFMSQNSLCCSWGPRRWPWAPPFLLPSRNQKETLGLEALGPPLCSGNPITTLLLKLLEGPSDKGTSWTLCSVLISLS